MIRPIFLVRKADNRAYHAYDGHRDNHVYHVNSAYKAYGVVNRSWECKSSSQEWSKQTGRTIFNNTIHWLEVGGHEMRERVVYLCTAQVAKRFTVAQDTVRRWIADGRLPGAINVGPKGGRPTYRIPQKAVELLEEELGYELLTDV